MSRQTLSSIVHRTGPITVPRPDTLAKLAKGLGVSLHTVETAAALAIASDQSGSEAMANLRMATLIGYAQALTEGELEVLLATARALASQGVSLARS
jgi:3-methyladenine DNA glycosylase/8-oxoguanine DNA glycosylase